MTKCYCAEITILQMLVFTAACADNNKDKGAHADNAVADKGNNKEILMITQ